VLQKTDLDSKLNFRDRFLALKLDRLLDRVSAMKNLRQENRTGFSDRKQDLRHVFKQNRIMLRQPVPSKKTVTGPVSSL